MTKQRTIEQQFVVAVEALRTILNHSNRDSYGPWASCVKIAAEALDAMGLARRVGS